jgi:hippurate hydrolase
MTGAKPITKRGVWLGLAIALAARSVAAAGAAVPTLDSIYPALDALYLDLHRNPELSLHEEATASKLAQRMKEIGCEVTQGVGGHGVVAVLRNGNGPVIMLRADLDALPIAEETGLEYASRVETKNTKGETVSVMHACGHDVHMTAWVGAAMVLAGCRDRWNGTLVFIGQPAEEIGQGAKNMIADGLLKRFPKPDYVLGLHVSNALAAGVIGVVSGPSSAASNAVDITFYGKGGHGAMPHRTVDPVVMASRAVVTLQTIVAREVDPFDTAVVTVGVLRAGSKRNVIPDEARLELTVRSYKPELQARLLEAIARIARAEAEAAAAPRPPEVRVIPEEATEVVVNDPRLAARLLAGLQRRLGETRAVGAEPVTTSEDFGVFGRVAAAPALQFWIGACDAKQLAQAQAAGTLPTGLHNAKFAPVREPTIRGAVEAFTLSVFELLGSSETK